MTDENTVEVGRNRCRKCKNAIDRKRYAKIGKRHLISGPMPGGATETNLAYLAGIIDADGYVSCEKKNYKGRMYCGPIIGISGTDSEPHELAHSFWGGSLTSHRPKNVNHRLQFNWRVGGLRAATALKGLEPYLLIKKKQALLALEMWRMIEAGSNRSNPLLVELGARISSLNLRNPPLKPAIPKVR